MNLTELLAERTPRAIAVPLSQHRDGQRKFGVQATTDGASKTTAEVFVYDYITPDNWFGGGVAAREFVSELVALDVDEITVRINSPGGDVYDALAITNALRNHSARIVTVVEGLAASAASIIAMAGDEIVMCRNAEMMIHDARGAILGTATDVAEYATWLDKVSANLATVYADRAGGTAEDWRAAMHSETWYSAEEAVEAGLADSVGQAPAKGAPAAARAERAVARYDGRAAAPAPFIPKASNDAEQSSAEAAENPREKEATMATLKEGLIERLGLSADADDDSMLKALDDALDTPTAPAQEAEPAAANLPDGVVAVDSERLKSLEDNNARFQAHLDEQRAQAVNSEVEQAIADGRISPKNREKWHANLTADFESGRDLLASLAPSSAVPMRELGHSTEPTDTDVTNDAAYKSWEF